MKTIISDMASGKEVFFACKKQNISAIFTQQDIDDAWERLKSL